MTDFEPATISTYCRLRNQLKTATFVPVHSEAVSITFSQEDFPPTRVEWGVIRIARLSPLVRRVIDWPDFSFGAYMTEQPDGATQVHQWISPILTKLRQIELQLIMDRLTLLLGGSSLTQTSASALE